MVKFPVSIFVISLLLFFSGMERIEANEQKYGSLKGVLVAKDNIPLSDEAIYLVWPARILRYSKSTNTNKNGEFSFEQIPIGEYVLVFGPFNNQGCWVTVTANGTKTVKLILVDEELQSLKGIVTADNRTANAGIVSFMQLDPKPSRLVWPPKILRARIQEDGQYKINAIQPGRYLIIVQPPASKPSFSYPYPDSPPKKNEKKQSEDHKTVRFIKIVDIKPGQETLNLSTPKSVLEGTITDSFGKPVPGLMLFLSPSEIKSGWVPVEMSAWAGTDPNGTFRFLHLDPGSYDFTLGDSRISPPSCGIQLMKCVRVTNGRTSIEWKLNKPVTVRPSIGFSDKTPELPYMMVISEQHPKLRSMSEYSFILCDESSFYPVFITFPAGKYKVFAMAKEGNYSCEASIVEFAENTEISPELVPAGTIRVILKGKREDTAGRIVRLWDRNGNEVPRLYDPLWSYDFDLIPAVVLPTCKDGITTIGWLRPGRYELTVDGAAARTQVAVRANETVAVSIQLE